jgi:hypothetical protein
VIGAPDARYMYVPPEQQRHWGRYCRHYDACGHPVYFVREQWVRERWEHERAYRRDHDDRRFHHDNGRDEGWRNQGDHEEPWRDRR